MNPTTIAAVGAVALIVPLAAVGAVFVGVWAIEARDRRRNQVLLVKSPPTPSPSDLAAFRRAAAYGSYRDAR